MKRTRIRDKKDKRITGSVAAKIIAFFILAVSCVSMVLSAVGTFFLWEEGVYAYPNMSYQGNMVAYEKMWNYANEDMEQMCLQYFEEGDMEAVNRLCNDSNCMVEIIAGASGEVVVSNYNGIETPYTYTMSYTKWEEPETEEEDTADTIMKAVSGMIKGKTEEEGKEENSAIKTVYECRLYVKLDFPVFDKYSVAYQQAVTMCEWKYMAPGILIASVLVCLFSFLFLMCSAGHKNGKEGITPSVLTPIPYEIFVVIFGFVALLGFAVFQDMTYYSGTAMIIIAACVIGTLEAVWCTIFCMETALRMKLGKWWRHTLVYGVFRCIRRLLKFVGKSIAALVKGMPLITNTVLIFLAVSVVEFIGLCIWARSSELVIVWLLEKFIVFPIVMYLALVCKKLQQGSKALAEGDLSYKIDTEKMFLDFKEHGENLNRIGEGISKAVEERMRSEHLKTELITNVSHDLKTPLTSIINYADLIGYEVLTTESGAALDPIPYQREKVAEYSEVLLRQSKRLKKLLEDLVEASKATTGSLEVNLQQCEIGVLLSQAVGEYEQRLAEKQLEIIIRQPEEPVRILADGRHLWRVFDNLLNNICKYAQEYTRVYLSVEQKQNSVEIIFRNMSKYALDISAQELEERFVRGDKSRHMEGNGLGLSIAKSLVELQNGRMEIVIDGDLFKVVLYFDAMEV